MDVKRFDFPHSNLWVEFYEYGLDEKKVDVSFNYVERQADPWYTDSETDVEVTEETARELVKFFAEAFGWEDNDASSTDV